MDFEREQAERRLVTAAVRAGFPQEFGIALADFLGGPKTMDRMASYLVSVRPHSIEEAADEAVALVEERSRWVEQMRSEEANAAYTQFLNRPRDPEDEDELDGNGVYEEYYEEQNGQTDDGEYYEVEGSFEEFDEPGLADRLGCPTNPNEDADHNE